MNCLSDMLLIPARIEKVSTRADLTMKVVIGTQEATPAAAELVMLNRKFVYVAIKEVEFTAEEMRELGGLQSDFVDDTKKTPSARLRAVLYRIWEVDNKGYEDFNLFYLYEMERIIKHFKSKI